MSPENLNRGFGQRAQSAADLGRKIEVLRESYRVIYIGPDFCGVLYRFPRGVIAVGAKEDGSFSVESRIKKGEETERVKIGDFRDGPVGEFEELIKQAHQKLLP